jgi:hypothetical protein
MPREDGQFGPGNVPSNPPPDTTGMVLPSPVLSAFRRVFKQAKSKDKDAEKAVRKLLEENPKEFFSQLERMERELNERRAAKAAGAGRGDELPAANAPAEADARLEAVDELIGELLREWEAKE